MGKNNINNCPERPGNLEDVTLPGKVFRDLLDNESKYSGLFENMSSGVAVYKAKNGGKNFIFTDFNKAAEKIEKIDRAQVIGKDVIKVFPSVKKFGLLGAFRKVYKTGKPVEHPIKLYMDKRISGWRRNYVFKIPSGEIVSIYDDITLQKITENELEESEKRFRNLFENSPIGILTMDRSGIVTSCNKAISRFTGYPNDYIIGKHFTKMKFSKKNDIHRFVKIFAGLMKGENFDGLIVEWKHKNGKMYTGELRTSPIEENKKIIGLQAIIRDISEQKEAERQLEKSYIKLQKTLDDTINTLASIVEIRDPYTSGHQRKVADIATAIANEMNLPRGTINAINVAALIHDIGKINIPASILSRPDKLSDLEFAMIKTHPKIGSELISNIDFPWPIATIILQHHERIDGSGYPDGLKDKDIMLEAKIIAVADVVEAMSSHRPYRPALGINEAIKEIEKNRGKLYDSRVVIALINVLNKQHMSNVRI